MKRVIVLLVALGTAFALAVPAVGAGAKSPKSQIDVNVLLNTDITARRCPSWAPPAESPGVSRSSMRCS